MILQYTKGMSTMESYKEQRSRELADLLRAVGLRYQADRRCRRTGQRLLLLGSSKCGLRQFRIDAARGETKHEEVDNG